MLEKGSNGADFRMRYYNRDGGEAEMCGNGARCFARFANRVADAPEKISFETPAGLIRGELHGELVTLQMSEPKDLRLGIDVRSGRRRRQAFISSTAACRTSSFRSHEWTMSTFGDAVERFDVTKCFRRRART